jgi:hypothetical protein
VGTLGVHLEEMMAVGEAVEIDGALEGKAVAGGDVAEVLAVAEP